MGFLSKITKPFKKIARKIKKTAGKVMGGIMKLPGFKQLGQLYGKTFGKLGPLGMIAASFVLPGLGTMISGAWGSVAGALSAPGAGGFLNAVSAGMTNISTTLGGIGTSITEKISGAFTKMGGDTLTQGISNTFQKASDWVTGGKNPSAFNFDATGFSKEVAVGPQSQFDFGKAFTGPEQIPTPEFTGVPTKALADIGAPKFAVSDSLLKPKLTPSAGVTPGQAIDTSKLTFDSSPLAPSRASVLAKKTAKGAASMLLNKAQAPITAELPPLPGVADFSATPAQRGGISGQGATGGQFLTPQQQAFFQQHASLLGQAG